MSEPLYQKIEQDLREKIKSGTYGENDLIPTEMELSESYGVSRPTVRQAIQTLVNEGYLEKRRKRGTIVKKAKIEQEFTRYIKSFDSEMSQRGMFPQTKVLTFTKTTATEEVAENLDLNVNDPVYKLTRLRFAEEKPVVFVTSFIPCYLLPDLETVDFSKQSLYATFKQMGHPIQSATRKLEITLCDETTSYLLDVNENDPLFYFHTKGLTTNQVPIEYSIAKYRGDINAFVFEVSV